MIDPADPPEIQVAKQARIIDALIRRANRQHELGGTAYAAFQSAIALQGQVWAKTRDLERTESELETVRFDRERTRKNLTDALGAMEGGFALFTEGRLEVCNDLFRTLLPDLSGAVLPGLALETYLEALRGSDHLVATDGQLTAALGEARNGGPGAALLSFVVELKGDRWYQISLQRTSSDNIVILQTEITGIVRQNRHERKTLVDMQAQYLQAAFENMSAGICTFSAEGVVILHNARFGDLLGLPQDMPQKGTSLDEILASLSQRGLILDAAILDPELWRERLSRQGRLRRRVRRAGGRVLELHAHLLPDHGFLVDLKDITLEARATEVLEKRVDERTADLTEANHRLTAQYEAQARVEEELRLAKEQAEAAVSSKTRFLAAASHDLLQPVNAAKLLIATLSESSAGSGLERMIDRLEGSFASIEELLHALLDISRLDATDAALTPSDVWLAPLMQGVLEDQALLAARKGVRLSGVASSLTVRSDQRYLMRSIRNLVVNAIQYTPAGGRVVLGCRRRGDRVALEVWDTGIGISRTDQARIFDEFTRAGDPAAGAGMGLGLSIVERTCRHMGHEVGVRSTPGVGSVFSIEMALAEPRAAVQHELFPAPVSGEDRQVEMDLIVLVVENDADVLFATTQQLEHWGASVLPAASTEEALGLVRDIGMAPDIILADFQLDGDDTGIATIRALRAETASRVPAIMITADRSPELVRQGAELGFTVLTKPVELARLRPLIDWKTRWQGGAPVSPPGRGGAETPASGGAT